MKSSEGNCQTSTTRSSVLREESGASAFPLASAKPMLLEDVLLSTGECTSAARLVRSRELRLAFGKNDVEGEAGQVRRDSADARRGFDSPVCWSEAVESRSTGT